MPAAGAYCRPLRHSKSRGGLTFQEALLSVLHLCPPLPMGGGGLGLTERVQHINFSCIAESLFPHATPSVPDPIPRPHPYLFTPQEDGPGGWPRSRIPFHSACWAVNTAQHQEQQVLSLPIINYPCCITLGPLAPKLQISISCTILLSSLQPFRIFSHVLEFKLSHILSMSTALQQFHFFFSISTHLSPYFLQSYNLVLIRLFPDVSQSLSSTHSFPQVIPSPTDSLARFLLSSDVCLLALLFTL